MKYFCYITYEIHLMFYTCFSRHTVFLLDFILSYSNDHWLKKLDGHGSFTLRYFRFYHFSSRHPSQSYYYIILCFLFIAISLEFFQYLSGSRHFPDIKLMNVIDFPDQRRLHTQSIRSDKMNFLFMQINFVRIFQMPNSSILF